jgi:hypothetical protein
MGSEAVSLSGPGELSLDYKLGLQVPPWLAIGAAIVAAGTLDYGITVSAAPAQPDAPASQDGQDPA